jgi:hypothetical protein
MSELMRAKIVLGRRSANNGFLKLKPIVLGSLLAVMFLALALMLAAPKAEATPSFARQTGRNCNFCHSGVPRLNNTGLAFKNNGFRFSDSDKAPDKEHQDTPAQ